MRAVELASRSRAAFRVGSCKVQVQFAAEFFLTRPEPCSSERGGDGGMVDEGGEGRAGEGWDVRDGLQVSREGF